MYPIISLNVEINGQKHDVVLLTPDYGFSRMSAINQCRCNGLIPAPIEFANALLQQHENVLRGIVGRWNEDRSCSVWDKTILALGSLVVIEEGVVCCQALQLAADDFFTPRSSLEQVLCSSIEGLSECSELNESRAHGGDLVLAVRP